MAIDIWVDVSSFLFVRKSTSFLKHLMEEEVGVVPTSWIHDCSSGVIGWISSSPQEKHQLFSSQQTLCLENKCKNIKQG